MKRPHGQKHRKKKLDTLSAPWQKEIPNLSSLRKFLIAAGGEAQKPGPEDKLKPKLATILFDLVGYPIDPISIDTSF